VTRLSDFLPIGLLLKDHWDFCNVEVAKEMSTFWATFCFGNFLLHFNLNWQFKNMFSNAV
jgi:hypothetical protein